MSCILFAKTFRLYFNRKYFSHPSPIGRSAIDQLEERRSLASELHTNLVRVRTSPASMYFQSGSCIDLSKCMWSGCHRADPMVSQAYSRDAEIWPGFPPPQAALVSVAYGEKGLWVV